MTNCKGCGAVLPPNRAPGRERLWCSDRCRKSQYDGTCERCGGRFDGTSPGQRKVNLCISCWNIIRHEEAEKRLVAEIRRWAELYGQPPTASEWNVPFVRWQRAASADGRASGSYSATFVAELERRHANDGPWPYANTVQRIFGSWNAGIKAAGFDAIESGGGRRERAVAA